MEKRASLSHLGASGQAFTDSTEFGQSEIEKRTLLWNTLLTEMDIVISENYICKVLQVLLFLLN